MGVNVEDLVLMVRVWGLGFGLGVEGSELRVGGLGWGLGLGFGLV